MGLLHQLVVVVLVVAGGCSAHEWGLGACPTVQAVPNLALDKFLGEWYVIQQTDTDSHCLKFVYTRESEIQLRVTKLRQFSMLDTVGLDHTNSYSGTLDLPYENDLGRMRVRWPLNMAGKADYIVFDTDYTNYAGVYTCQQITTVMHRKSAAILSRKPTLDQTYIDRINRRLATFHAETGDMDAIQHTGCISRNDADLNINVGPDTFSNVLKNARDGVEHAASSVSQGFRDFANNVASTFRNAFGQGSSTSGSPSSGSPSSGSHPTTDTRVPGVEVGVPLDVNLRTPLDAVPETPGNVEKNFNVDENTSTTSTERSTTTSTSTTTAARSSTTASTTTTQSTTTRTTTASSTTTTATPAATHLEGNSLEGNAKDTLDNKDPNYYNVDGSNNEPVDVINTLVKVE